MKPVNFSFLNSAGLVGLKDITVPVAAILNFAELLKRVWKHETPVPGRKKGL
jgi:hypothetical protein